MESLLEEQDEGIQDKMAEVKMYTDMLEKLKRANGAFKNFASQLPNTKYQALSPKYRVPSSEVRGSELITQSSILCPEYPVPDTCVLSSEFRDLGFGSS
ncbi:hypothetical protein BDR05DRAFT_1005943 [Suillus weaverae]|nr:hypothetical protein BDR05DRAFT_1005943 [Suillus weaverae]